jgi:hypothetical protein
MRARSGTNPGRLLFGDGYAQGFAKAVIQVCPETLVETVGRPNEVPETMQMIAGQDAISRVRVCIFIDPGARLDRVCLIVPEALAKGWSLACNANPFTQRTDSRSHQSSLV